MCGRSSIAVSKFDGGMYAYVYKRKSKGTNDRHDSNGVNATSNYRPQTKFGAR